VFDLTCVRNLKKTRFFIFFNFLIFSVFVVQVSRKHDIVISTMFRLARPCRRATKKLFEVSLKEYLRNFLRVFFFFADHVGQSNGWLNAVVLMIRFKKIEKLKKNKKTGFFKFLTRVKLNTCKKIKKQVFLNFLHMSN
jgi:hypothetical protein